MAHKLGLEVGDWQAMLAGGKRIPVAALATIARMTQVPLASFFTGDFVARP